MAEIADKEYPLQEYTRATAEIEKTQQALEKLKAKEQELKTSGKNTTLSDDYVLTQKRLEKANSEMDRLNVHTSLIPTKEENTDTYAVFIYEKE